jgi:large subunit ribosomal protein L20
MSRVKRGFVSRRKHKKVLKNNKGFVGSLSKLYRPAHQAYLHSLANAYIGRKLRKRDFRSLWIARMNAALDQLGVSYSKFIGNANKKNITLSRKTLSELAIAQPETFKQIVDVVQQ